MVKYLLAFHEKGVCSEKVRALLQEQLPYITSSTIWLLGLDDFWRMEGQKAVRLIASFTICDRFENNIDNMINFAARLKSPPKLADAWLKGVVRRAAPLTWKEFQAQYRKALQSVKTDDEVLMVANEHLLDWPEKIFGSHPLHSGLTAREYWAQLRSPTTEDIK